MRYVFTVAVALLLALPASAAVQVDSVRWASDGICVDLRSTGAAGVRVSVEDEPDYGFVHVHWSADGVESLTLEPLREGTVARTSDPGNDDQGRIRRTVWIPTEVAEPVEFMVEITEDGATIQAEPMGAPQTGGTTCAAAPAE